MHPIYCIITIPPRNQHARIVAQLAQLPAFILSREDAEKFLCCINNRLRIEQRETPPHDAPKEILLATALLLAYRNLGSGVGTPFEFPAIGTCTLQLNYFTE